MKRNKPEKPGKPSKPGKPDKVKKPKKPKKPKPNEPVDPVEPEPIEEPEAPIDPVAPAAKKKKKKKKAKAVKSFEELEAQFEGSGAKRLEFNDIEDLTLELDDNGEIPLGPPRLDMDEIAMIAYEAVAQYEAIIFPEQATKDGYHLLSDDQKAQLKNDVNEILQSASNPNDVEVSRLKHCQRAMSLLAQGYKYAEHENESDKVSPLVKPWEYLGNEYRMSLIMFRTIARNLLTGVWIGH